MDGPRLQTQTPDRTPLVATLICFGLWGLMPLLFQGIGRAGGTPWEALCWRTVVALPCAIVLVAATRQGGALLALLARPRTLGLLTLSAAVIAVNWGVYIWAVANHHTLAASLGYYINPLFNMAAAALLFRERVGPFGRAAIALAVVGVALQAVALGQPPWTALILAFSFGSYSIVRKVAAVEAQTGFLVECLILAVPAAAYLTWLTLSGDGVFGTSLAATGWLLASGPWTAIPLIAFAYAARRLPLTAISFIQFLTPTMLFAIGALQGEALSALRLISFAFIWAGAAVFAFGAWRRSRV